MAKRNLIPLALCYDFDGTLAPGNMQERDFIPSIGMTTARFWNEVNQKAKEHEADNILMYMKLMLDKADAAAVPVRKRDFEDYGSGLELFPGVFSSKTDNWFRRITEYGKRTGVDVQHYVISSGIREMVAGTPINRYFAAIFASSFLYDHHGVARWPALALNYTTKTQYLFRINKGCLDVWDHEKINEYIPHEKRSVPFSNMVFIGDGETDIPCFRLIKDQGGHAIAVYRPKGQKAKAKAEKIFEDRRVNFVSAADYTDDSKLDRTVKRIIDKVAFDTSLYALGQR